MTKETHKEHKKEEPKKDSPKVEPKLSAEAVLQTKVQELEEKAKADQDKYLRLFAEFDNYRKRTQAEKEEFGKYATTDLLKKLLPLMDSFEQARVSFEKHSDEKEELKKGLALIHKQFEDILLLIGVKKIEAAGKKFDPHFHEAIIQQEKPGVASGLVIEEARPGFMIHDRVLRPAMVIVAK